MVAASDLDFLQPGAAGLSRWYFQYAFTVAVLHSVFAESLIKVGFSCKFRNTALILFGTLPEGDMGDQFFG